MPHFCHIFATFMWDDWIIEGTASEVRGTRQQPEWTLLEAGALAVPMRTMPAPLFDFWQPNRKVEKMRIISQDETVQRQTDIDPVQGIVELVRTTRASKNDPRVVMELTLDFSGCSNKDLLALATATVWIEIQRLWRSEPDNVRNDASKWERVWKVKDEILDRPKKRGPKDPVKVARNALAKLPEEERQRIIAEYLANQKAGK